MRVNAYWRIYGHPEIRRYLSGETQFQSRLRRSQDDVQRVLLQPVHILVRDGHITLEGEVEQLSDKRTVEDQARQVLGVLSVTNNVVVTGADTRSSSRSTSKRTPGGRTPARSPNPSCASKMLRAACACA